MENVLFLKLFVLISEVNIRSDVSHVGPNWVLQLTRTNSLFHGVNINVIHCTYPWEVTKEGLCNVYCLQGCSTVPDSARTDERV